MATGGGAHWNPQSQRWEWAEQPPPPPPSYPPSPPRGGGPGDQGGPGLPGGRRSWKVPLLVALGAAVVGGCAVAGWLVLRDEEPKAPAAAPPASGSPAAPSGTGPSTAPGTAPSAPSPSVPPPYTVVRDDGGFSVAVPAGWERSRDEDGSGSFYRRPGDRSALLQIFRVGEPDSVGTCELLRISSQDLGKRRPGYQEVSLDPTPGESCELVYEYDNQESHGRRRAIERITVAQDGKRWALLAAGPAADGRAVRANLTAAVESFRPE